MKTYSNKIFIFGTITSLFAILSSVNPSISQAESNNLTKGNHHLAVISEEVKQQLELIDSKTPPLLVPVQEVKFPKLSPEPISSPSTSLFKKFTNILVASFVGGVTNQTANILSSVTGFLSEIFTNKSPVPETIIPIKQSSSSSSRNEVAIETNEETSSFSDEDSVEYSVTNTNNTGTQTVSNSSLPSPTTYNLQTKTSPPSVTRSEVVELIKESDINQQILMNALIDASQEKSLSISESISSLEKKINLIDQRDSRQLDHVYNSVSRSFDDITALDGVTMTNSSFSGTTGTFTGNLSGTTGTFSGNLTLGSQLTVSGTATSTIAGDTNFDSSTLYVDSINNKVGIGTTSPLARLSIYGDVFLEGGNRYLNFGTTQGANGFGIRENGGMVEFRNNYSSTTANSSGWSPISSVSSVRYQLDEGGWVDTGANLADQVWASQAVIIGDYVYLFGGRLGESDTTNNIYRAPVSNPLSWTDTGANLPGNAHYSQLTIIGDYVYLFGGKTSGPGASAIYRAPISDPLSWVDTGSTIPTSGNLLYSQVAKIGDYVYLFGGTFWGGSNTSNIYRAPISDPLSWVDTGSDLPVALSDSQVATIGDYVYLFGGWAGGTTNNIYRAPVSNPLLWIDTGSDLPGAVDKSQVAIVGDYIYLLGGRVSGDKIYRAPVSNPLSWTDTGLKIPNNLYESQFVIIGNYGYLFGGLGDYDGIYRAPITSNINTNENWTLRPNAPTGPWWLTSSTTNSNLIFNSGGSVGIGTTSPYAKLSVTGTGVFDDNVRTSYFTATSTTATSTFAWGLQANALNITSTSATSTFARGIDLAGGCFAINGTCVGGSSGSGTVNSGTTGQLAFYAGSGTALTATSSLFIGTNQNVGIGTSSPYAKLSIHANNGEINRTLFNIASSTASATTSIFTILNNGKIGIGTDAPDSGLSVRSSGQNAVVNIYGASADTDYGIIQVSNSGGLSNPSNRPLVLQPNAGNVGIGTTSPWSLLSLKGSSGAQMTIAQADTNYTQLTVDASGNLTLTPSGSTITIPDDNLKVCSGSACQTTALNSGNGNLTVENNIEIGGNYNRTCATGYIWVPGSAKFGTLPGFCVMKYEASNVGGVATSDALNVPWESLDQPTSRTKCEAVGLGYHLISEPEWMTIAENIATTPINDMDDDAGLQLATGHSDSAPASALAATSASDPVVSGCNLSATMENSANAYSASSCEIQGDGSYTGDDNDKGFYGTSQAWATTGYSAGVANKSQLRTHVLSNGNVIWDIVGNVWEWTDAYVNNGTAEKPTPAVATWQEWTAVTNYLGLNYARPQNPSWVATNGIGKYLAGINSGQSGFLRGGGWSTAANVGVFTLQLDSPPSSAYTMVGFRCAR